MIFTICLYSYMKPSVLMLKQGVHPKIVQERLGHSSIQLTLDTYSHIVPGMRQSAALKFDDLLINNKL